MEPTYAFKNGNVYTISDGKVVASVKEADFVEKTAVHQFDDGWGINRLTPEEYPAQADAMGHCLPPELAEVYALRDAEGSPRGTYSPEIGAYGPNNNPLDPELMARFQEWDPSVGKQSKVAGGFIEEPVDNLDSDPEIQLPDPPDELQEDMLADIVECPACGSPSDASDSFCSKCGEPLGDGGLAGLGEDVGFGDDMLNARMVAKVTSPNGLEGKVVNRTPSLWGEEVTIRFANGRVKTMPVTSDMEFSKEAFEYVPGESHEVPSLGSDDYRTDADLDSQFPCLTDEECAFLGIDPSVQRPLNYQEKAALTALRAKQSTVASLRSKMDASVPGDLKSLQGRKAILKEVQREVANKIASADAPEKEALDQIALEASAESREIDDAIQHIAELEGREFIPTAPFKSSAVESAELGRTDGSWLHEVVANMNAEARGTDYGKLMNEGPEIFVAGSDDALVSDAAATRQAATRYVRSFTSAAVDSTTDQQRAKFETQFLARVEECRKGEQSSRKQAARKEASSVAESAVNAPDDSLFL